MSGEVREKAEKILNAHKRQPEKKKRYTLHSYGDGIANTFDRIIRRKNLPPGQISGVPTGFRGLDRITDGLQPGELVIIAGKTGKGKTALAMQILRYAAALGFPVGLTTIEMNEYQLHLREIAIATNIPIRDLHTGNITNSEEQHIMKIIDKKILHKLPVTISYDANTSQAVEGAGREMVEEKGCKLLVVDYLQLLKDENRTGSREQEVAGIITMLKGFAKRYCVPVIVISSLSRAADFATNKDPDLSQLRDSGNIEYAADIVLFLTTDWANRTAKIIFEKGRNYGKHIIHLKWDPYLTQYSEVEEVEGDE